MTIFLINNASGGSADYKEVSSNTTLETLISNEIGDSSSNYLVKVNKVVVPTSYLLQDGDRVTVTPKNIEGA